MPAAGDSDYFDAKLTFSATVNERNENSVDATSAYIRYGGLYYAGYMSFGTPDVVGEPSIKPGDRTMDGLAVTEATLSYYAYRSSSGTLPGLLYPLTQSIAPADVFWLNIKDHIGEKIDNVVANSTTPHRETNAYVSEAVNEMTSEEWARRFVQGAQHGLIFRGNYGSVIQNQKYVDIVNERGHVSQLPYIRFRAALVLPYADELAPNNGYINPTAASKVSWKFAYDPSNVWGVLHQDGATIEVKENGVTTTYTVSGETQEYTFAANTFSHDFEWRVKVTSEHGIDSFWSEWCPVSITDTLSTAVPVRPVNTFVDASANVVFQWQHVISTGTTQTKYELEYKTPEAVSWTALASATSSAQECTVAGSSLPSGTMYWRVRTANADLAWGSWSDPAAAIVQAPPAAPSISAITGTTIPTIKWQATGQQGFEISVDRVTSGTIYGTDKSFTWPAVLADGAHTIGVRVINQFSLWSNWSYGTFTAENHPGNPLDLTATVEDYGVALYWSDGSTVEVWRDGKRIATASSSPYVDYTAAGTHQYFLRRHGGAVNFDLSWERGYIKTDGSNQNVNTSIRSRYNSSATYYPVYGDSITVNVDEDYIGGIRVYTGTTYTTIDTSKNETAITGNDNNYDIGPAGRYIKFTLQKSDGTNIATSAGSNLQATYTLQADYYTDSPTVTVTMTTQDAGIAVDGEWNWLPLVWSEGDFPGISTTLTPVMSLVQFSGRSLPAAEVSAHQTRGHDIAYALFEASDRQTLVAMLGKLVWYRHGDQIIRGMLTSIGEARLWWGWNETLHIEEVSTVEDGRL